MTSEERIHYLFNKLNKALVRHADEIINGTVRPYSDAKRVLGMASAVDGAHHDFANLTLDNEPDSGGFNVRNST